MDEVTRIPVGGERPYDVLVGRDLLDALPGLLPGATRVAVLHAPPLKALADALGERLRAAGVDATADRGARRRGGQARSRWPPPAGTGSARPASPVPTRWSGWAAAR